MPVYFEDPVSPKIERFLLKTFGKGKKPLSLLDPESGIEIDVELKNLSGIGLTYKPTPSHNPGIHFPGMRIDLETRTLVPDSKDRPRFVPEALLDLNVPFSSLPVLPDDVKEAWVLQVNSKADLPNYTPIAIALEKAFKGVAIFVTYETESNPDMAAPTVKPTKLSTTFSTGKIVHVTEEPGK